MINTLPKYDNAGDHVWITEFDNGSTKRAVSYARKGKGKDQGIRIRVGKSERGSVNYIYLWFI